MRRTQNRLELDVLSDAGSFVRQQRLTMINDALSPPQDVVLRMLQKCKCRSLFYKDVLFGFDLNSKRMLEFFKLVLDYFREQQKLQVQIGTQYS